MFAPQDAIEKKLKENPELKFDGGQWEQENVLRELIYYRL